MSERLYVCVHEDPIMEEKKIDSFRSIVNAIMTTLFTKILDATLCGCKLCSLSYSSVLGFDVTLTL